MHCLARSKSTFVLLLFVLFLVLSSQDKSSYYTDRNAWETYADMPRHCVQSHLVYVGITCMELVYVCLCSNLYPKNCILSTTQCTQELVCLVDSPCPKIMV